MVRGSRHSKNPGTMGYEALTYFEKRSLGYGMTCERLNKESLGDFFDCQLTLQPAEKPVCTPSGILYSEEAILESLLFQKQEIKRKMRLWLDSQHEESFERTQRFKIEKEFELLKFRNVDEVVIDHDRSLEFGSEKLKKLSLNKKKVLISGGVNFPSNRDRIQKMKAQWANNGIIREEKYLYSSPKVKPYYYTICPITHQKLKFRDLVYVIFTQSKTKFNESYTPFYIDPITKDVLTNRARLICLRPTGDVLLLNTYKSMIEPHGNYNGHNITTSDVIDLQQGGTGYVSHDGQSAIVSKYAPLGLNSGMTDLRGQHSGSGAKAGMVLL